jgi:hypothetical protein
MAHLKNPVAVLHAATGMEHMIFRKPTFPTVKGAAFAARAASAVPPEV